MIKNVLESQKNKSGDEIVYSPNKKIIGAIKNANVGDEITLDIPVDKYLYGHDSEEFPSTQHDSGFNPKSKREIKEPIRVNIEYIENPFIEALDGNHRIVQARFNKDKTIPAKLEITKELKAQADNFNYQKSIAEAYHAAKADGSNPELVKAVEELLAPNLNNETTNKVSSAESLITPDNTFLENKEINTQNKTKSKPIIMDTTIEKTMPIKSVKDIPEIVRQFMSINQQKALIGSQEHTQILQELADTITNMPVSYGTDGQGEQAIAYLHYFNSGSDWYITERDVEDEQLQAFGFAVLNGDMQFAEMGYISIEELKENNVEIDLFWQPISIGEIKNKRTPDEPKPSAQPLPKDTETDVPNLENLPYTKKMLERQKIYELPENEHAAHVQALKDILNNENSNTEQKNEAHQELFLIDETYANEVVGNVVFKKYNLIEHYDTKAIFPQMNKQGTMDEYRYEYERSTESRKLGAIETVRIVRAVAVDDYNYRILANSLLDTIENLYEPEVGGSEITDEKIVSAGYDLAEFTKKLQVFELTPSELDFYRKNSHTIAGMVYNTDTGEHYLYNCEGYAYARYAGWFTHLEDVKQVMMLISMDEPTQTTETTEVVVVNEMDELRQQYEAALAHTKQLNDAQLRMVEKSMPNSIAYQIRTNICGNLYVEKFAPFMQQTLEYQMSLPSKAQVMLDAEKYTNSVSNKELIKDNIWNIIPTELKKPVRVKKIAYTASPQDKNLAEIIKPFVLKDGLRPNLNGVNFDKFGITATDANKMLFVKTKVKERGIYCMHPNCFKINDGNETVDGKFPDYTQVIPSSNHAEQNVIHVNGHTLLHLIDALQNVSFTTQVEAHRYHSFKKAMLLNMNGKSGEDAVIITFDIELLHDCIKAMIQLGYDSFDAAFTTSNRGVLFTPKGKTDDAAELKTDFILCMPLYNYNTDFNNTNDEQPEVQVCYDLTTESVYMINVEAAPVSLHPDDLAAAQTQRIAKQAQDAQAEAAMLKQKLNEVIQAKEVLKEDLLTETRKREDKEMVANIDGYSVLRYVQANGKEAIRIQNLSVDEEIDNPEIYRMDADGFTNMQALAIAKKVFEDRKQFAEKTETQRKAQEELSVDEMREALESAEVALEFTDDETEKQELVDYIEALKIVLETETV